MDRSFEIKFRVIDNNIQTEIKQKNISPQEAIGLLEMAKSQILENLAKGRKEIFSGMKKGE
ncbi:MAG: hypothetical protein KKA65_01700 [Nanoarchaeota archaeon]|nr:hypothetical protein [Nanoarchaeota archaeon]MBU4456191.1 hypothetical protein [Nanoarchaeota archaeon]MCG2719945.1 hypothetical protein [Nanoarchaeota archaeon]